MTTREKDLIKLRLGLAVQRKIEDNKLTAEKIKEKGKEDQNLVTSLRKLEYSSGISYANIYLLATGTKNTSFTTLSAVLEGLEIAFDEFFANYYYKIPEKEVEQKLEDLAKKKRKSQRPIKATREKRKNEP